MIRVRKDQRGSLALEQILFIGAVVAMTAGVWAFYGTLGSYFQGVTVTPPPINFGSAPTN